MFDLDQDCDLVTRNPDQRRGPMSLRSAVGFVVRHRPPAERIELRLRDGQTLGDTEIEAIYIIGVLPS